MKYGMFSEFKVELSEIIINCVFIFGFVVKTQPLDFVSSSVALLLYADKLQFNTLFTRVMSHEEAYFLLNTTKILTYHFYM